MKSADDLNEQKRESDVLITALEKCKELEEEIRDYRSALIAIQIHTTALGEDEKEMAKSLLEIHNICKFIFDE